MKRLLTMGMLTLLLSQCAVRYKPIEPEKVEYDQFFEDESLKLSYRYHVLDYRGNHKLSKLERKANLTIVAAAFTNKSTRTLNIDRDLDIFTDAEDPYYIEGKVAAKRMAQHPRAYLFYTLLIYGKFDCEFHGLNCAPRYIIPAGVPVAIYNLYRAKKANARMSAEFEKYSVYTRDIEPGQTVYAILAFEFEGKEFLPLQVEVRENSKM